MITIIADTQHIAKRYARIVGASDEDTRHYVGNNYAVTWLEGIDLGFSPELSKTLDRLSPTAVCRTFLTDTPSCYCQKTDI